MKLRKLMTERESSVDVDIYAACEDDGTVICHDGSNDFNYIINGAGFDSAMSQLFNPETKAELVVKEGRCQGKYTLFTRTPHALNDAPEEFSL